MNASFNATVSGTRLTFIIMVTNNRESVGLLQFAMIIYSNDAVVIFDLDDSEGDTVASLQATILGVDLIGNLTATPAALLEAVNQFVNFDRDDALYPDVAVTFTDGFTNVPIADPDGALMDAATQLQDVTS